MMVFLIYIISGVIFGAITSSINKSKGYDGGFAWGFFLGIIGLIVVAVRPYCVRADNKTEEIENY